MVCVLEIQSYFLALISFPELVIISVKELVKSKPLSLDRNNLDWDFILKPLLFKSKQPRVKCNNTLH